MYLILLVAPTYFSDCFDCIKKWSEQSNTCPLCKQRFAKIVKVVEVGISCKYSHIQVPSRKRKRETRATHTARKSKKSRTQPPEPIQRVEEVPVAHRDIPRHPPIITTFLNLMARVLVREQELPPRLESGIFLGKFCLRANSETLDLTLDEDDQPPLRATRPLNRMPNQVIVLD
jgi:hypothetical protein